MGRDDGCLDTVSPAGGQTRPLASTCTERPAVIDVPCLIMHHVKKNMGVEVWLHTFFTSLLDGVNGQLHVTGKDLRRTLDGRLTLPRIESSGPALSIVSMLTELTRARNKFPA
jgi:hypothetical protein